MIENLNLLKEKFSGSISINENLSKYNWFNLGGPAEMLFKPKNIEQLKEFLIINKSSNNKIHILGAGSNTLFRDGGVKGVTIKLTSGFSEIKIIKNNIIIAGAAALDKKVSKFAQDNSLSGLEFLSCIPGSVGGAIVMNSGCYDQDMSKILVSINTLDFDGNEKEISKNEIIFNYRGTNLPKNLIITSVKLKGELSNSDKIIETQNTMIDRKNNSQPNRIKTCGSTFKNTQKIKAWKLIKETDSHLIKCGDAIISEKHCNFFVNKGSAKSSDIEQLISEVRENVFKKTGIKLELELKVVGDPK